MIRHELADWEAGELVECGRVDTREDDSVFGKVRRSE